MNSNCLEFRARLARALVELPAPLRAGFVPVELDGAPLAWHEHVLTCADCRELLEAEEALEALLASLPEPSLPPELVRRVLDRLQPARHDLASELGSERMLDRLLDRALSGEAGAEVRTPADLSRDVLARLAEARKNAAREARIERALDALLDSVPTPAAAPGLSARVSKSLQLARHASRSKSEAAPQSVAQSRAPVAGSRAESRVSAAPRARPVPSRAWLAAAAVIVLVGGAAFLWRARNRAELGSGNGEVVENEKGAGSSALPSPNDVRAPALAQATDEAGNGPTSLPLSGPVAPPEVESPAPDVIEPDAELLAQLDLLESWDLLTDEALDFELLGIDANTMIGLDTTGLDSESNPSDAAPDSDANSGAGARKG